MSTLRSSPPALPAAFEVFPPRLNPHADAAIAHLDQWTRDTGLIGTAAARDRFAQADFGWFAAVTYPTADERGLCLIADWFAWLFLLDDQLDDGGLGKDPARTGELISQMFEVLGGDGRSVPEDAPSLVTSLADLWRRTHAAPGWRERFVRHVIAGGLAARWEAENRVAGIVPDLASYVENRRHTGAIYVCMDLIEVVEHLDVPDAVYESEPFARALGAACDVVCWTNDLYSLDKETALGEHHNLVTVVQHAHRLTADRAIDEVSARIAGEIEAFLRYEDETLRAWPAHAALLAAHFAGMRSWMRGNLDWSARTRRYRDAAHDRADAAAYLEPVLVDATAGAAGEGR
ncbi:terpene synthase family protein [Streptomyces lasiicapitis]|uniref:terpene synthase family protein n=1 Tax=Streptomyces lasiicapitis TaxID=1923961 RepID=UPI00166DC65A|nr:terpene cyclase [Streptomyces lasiicapitis]